MCHNIFEVFGVSKSDLGGDLFIYNDPISEKRIILMSVFGKGQHDIVNSIFWLIFAS